MQPVKAKVEDIRPLYDKILVKRVAGEQVTKGGIIVPQVAQDNNPPMEGIVLAVGHGRYVADNPGLQPLAVSVGDRVLFQNSPSLCTEIPLEGGGTVLLMSEHLLIAKVSNVKGDPRASLLALTAVMHPYLCRDLLQHLEGLDVTTYNHEPAPESVPPVEGADGLLAEPTSEEVVEAAASLLPEGNEGESNDDK